MSFTYERYHWRGGAEWMVRRGPDTGRRLLILPPLFEEGNFTRATIAILATELAEQGVATWLPDLPGTGESLTPLCGVTWDDWRDAVRGAAETVGRPHLLSIRGGALLDDAADARARFRFAPASGAALLRQMERAQAIGDREAGHGPTPDDAPVLDLVGYRIPRALAGALRAAAPAEIAPLQSEPFAGEGVAPWRRAEPVADGALAQALAKAVAEWIATCEA